MQKGGMVVGDICIQMDYVCVYKYVCQCECVSVCVCVCVGRTTDF